MHTYMCNFLTSFIVPGSEGLHGETHTDHDCPTDPLACIMCVHAAQQKCLLLCWHTLNLYVVCWHSNLLSVQKLLSPACSPATQYTEFHMDSETWIQFVCVCVCVCVCWAGRSEWGCGEEVGGRNMEGVGGRWNLSF